MFIETFLKMITSWEKPGCSLSEKCVDCGTSIQWITIWQSGSTAQQLDGCILYQIKDAKEIGTVAYIYQKSLTHIL